MGRIFSSFKTLYSGIKQNKNRMYSFKIITTPPDLRKRNIAMTYTSLYLSFPL